jgi:hypothetical protein
MEPDENGLTHVTLPEFINTIYDMNGEFKLDCLDLDGIGLDTNIVLVKLKEVAQRSKMGGNKGIHLTYEKEGV